MKVKTLFQKFGDLYDSNIALFIANSLLSQFTKKYEILDSSVQNSLLQYLVSVVAFCLTFGHISPANLFKMIHLMLFHNTYMLGQEKSML